MPQTPGPTPLSIAVSVGWFAVGALWFVQALVPWTATGTLSHSSALDAASLIRSGAVGSLAPSAVGWLLPALPAVGLVLCASAFSQHRATQVFRGVAVVATLVVTAALTHYLADFEVSKLGPGAWFAWVGCGVFVVNMVASLRYLSR